METLKLIKQDVYQAPDYYRVDELFSEEQLLTRAAVRDFVKKEISPIIEEYAQKGDCPKHLIPGLAQLGVFGPCIPEQYGGVGSDYITYGIMMQELERGDSGIRSMASVQGSLVMYPIFTYGSEDQKRKFLPDLASGKLLGCFGLTEPDYGSDPGHMRSRLIKKGNHYVLNGSKMWITNLPVADIAVVWAKDEQEQIRGVIVERGMPGFSASKIEDKWSLRASWTGEMVFVDVEIPLENVLPHALGIKGPLSCLNQARYGIAWGSIGAAMDCYDTALRYAKERLQFGKPIASFQLQQKKLAEMITEITKAQLLVWRLGQLKNKGMASAAQISMAKRNNVAISLDIARNARQILGAMGITGHYPIMRHMMNLESVITYEGTHDIHLLITGMDITKEDAFK